MRRFVVAGSLSLYKVQLVLALYSTSLAFWLVGFPKPGFLFTPMEGRWQRAIKWLPHELASENFVSCCERFMLFVDVLMQRIDDLIEAEGHATLEVLAVILRRRRPGASLECIVSLAQKCILKDLHELSSRDNFAENGTANPGYFFICDLAKKPLPVHDQIFTYYHVFGPGSPEGLVGVREGACHRTGL